MTDEARQMPITSWADWLERAAEVAMGAVMLTAESTQRLVNDLAARTHVTRDEAGILVDRLVAAGQKQRDHLQEMMEHTTERLIERMQLARRDEVDVLRRRIEQLERQAGQSEHLPDTAKTTIDEDMLLDQE